MSLALLTIGHSNRSIEEFLHLLELNGVTRLVDVRRFAGSRRLPQFGRDALSDSLAQRAIAYTHLVSLGGRRAPGRVAHDPTSDPGGAWRNASFRAYANYAQSQEYADALVELLELGERERCALMCSEAVPWRCHRWLVSDTLVARGARVLHVLSTTSLRSHRLTSFAQVDGTRVTWPGPTSDAPLQLGPEAALGAAR